MIFTYINESGSSDVFVAYNCDKADSCLCALDAITQCPSLSAL